MKYNQITIFTICTLTFLTFFSGIIRHDVKEEKYLKLAEQKQFECVGRIYKDTAASGSCVLINDKFVLSAAHIFIDSDRRQDTMQINGYKVIVFVPYNQRVTDVAKLYIIFKGKRIKAKKIIIHPNYLDSLTKGSSDIAFIELEQPLTGIPFARINTSLDELKSNVVGVGYGVSGPADKPQFVNSYNKKIAGENTVDSLSGTNYYGHETILMCDFDHPTRKDCNKMGSNVPRPLEYICGGGDSGGGLFRQKGEEWELIGICHGANTDVEQLMKTGYYGQTMEWTRTSVFTKWINENTN